MFAIGAGMDLLYHLSPQAWLNVLEIYLGKDGYNAHLVTFAGMLVTVIGVFSTRYGKGRSIFEPFLNHRGQHT